MLSLVIGTQHTEKSYVVYSSQSFLIESIPIEIYTVSHQSQGVAAAHHVRTHDKTQILGLKMALDSSIAKYHGSSP